MADIAEAPLENFQNMLSTLKEHLSEDILNYVLLPFIVDFEKELIRMIELKAKSVDPIESIGLTENMKLCISHIKDLNQQRGLLLRMAIKYDSLECFKLLESFGANPNMYVQELLVSAFQTMSTTMWQYLVGKGLELNDMGKLAIACSGIKSKDRSMIDYYVSICPTLQGQLFMALFSVIQDHQLDTEYFSYLLSKVQIIL